MHNDDEVGVHHSPPNLPVLLISGLIPTKICILIGFNVQEQYSIEMGFCGVYSEPKHCLAFIRSRSDLITDSTSHSNCSECICQKQVWQI